LLTTEIVCLLIWLWFTEWFCDYLRLYRIIQFDDLWILF